MENNKRKLLGWPGKIWVSQEMIAVYRSLKSYWLSDARKACSCLQDEFLMALHWLVITCWSLSSVSYLHHLPRPLSSQSKHCNWGTKLRFSGLFWEESFSSTTASCRGDRAHQQVPSSCSGAQENRDYLTAISLPVMGGKDGNSPQEYSTSFL